MCKYIYFFSQNLNYLLNFYSRESYNSLSNWLVDARTLASPNIAVLLVGNKKDLEEDREVTFLEASRFAQENGKDVFSKLYLKKKKKLS